MRVLAVSLLALLFTGCGARLARAIAVVQEVAAYKASHPGAHVLALGIRFSAMSPALNPGDAVLMDTNAYLKALPKPGDIVLFRAPLKDRRFVISRIVGVPGDRVEIKGGNLYLNGRQQPRASLFDVANYELRISGYRIESRYPDMPHWAILDRYANSFPRPARWEKPDRVPDGYHVLLGDARNDSPDSHIFGLVPAQAIKGKMIEKL